MGVSFASRGFLLPDAPSLLAFCVEKARRRTAGIRQAPLTAGSFPSSVGSASVISTDHVGGAALAPLGPVGINLPVDRIYADDIAAGVFQTVAIGRAASQSNGQ